MTPQVQSLGVLPKTGDAVTDRNFVNLVSVLNQLIRATAPAPSVAGSSSAATLIGAKSQIPAPSGGASLVIVALGGGNVGAVGLPTIADAPLGTTLILQNADPTGSLTLSDNGTIAGTLLTLQGATVTIPPNGAIHLVRRGDAANNWSQV